MMVWKSRATPPRRSRRKKLMISKCLQRLFSCAERHSVRMRRVKKSNETIK